RVELDVPGMAVAVHDDDLGRAGLLRTADGCVDLLGVELAGLLVERPVASCLFPPDDPGDALDVADDVNLHPTSMCSLAALTVRPGRGPPAIAYTREPTATT